MRFCMCILKCCDSRSFMYQRDKLTIFVVLVYIAHILSQTRVPWKKYLLYEAIFMTA